MMKRHMYIRLRVIIYVYLEANNTLQNRIKSIHEIDYNRQILLCIISIRNH
jgi:hypothetical protein